MTNSSPTNFQRGNVVLCRTPMPSTQLQEFKVRPAVIISASRLNDILEDVIIIPCTSNTNRSLTATQYLITGDEIIAAGIMVDSVVRCESIFTVNKSMIIRKLGMLTQEALEGVSRCLMLALEL
ncbi:transcriptional modulator of MazE/toxin MazF [Calothrix sp. NIES-4071]|nr:transcriptional modulator of MazE/toxin MazF [Calothrix sp. NIES-4071]BAZ60481.1 transcriptional modulator of MazE/toxin MazF [Calothrix sp. NIES-4105]